MTALCWAADAPKPHGPKERKAWLTTNTSKAPLAKEFDPREGPDALGDHGYLYNTEAIIGHRLVYPPTVEECRRPKVWKKEWPGRNSIAAFKPDRYLWAAVDVDKSGAEKLSADDVCGKVREGIGADVSVCVQHSFGGLNWHALALFERTDGLIGWNEKKIIKDAMKNAISQADGSFQDALFRAFDESLREWRFFPGSSVVVDNLLQHAADRYRNCQFKGAENNEEQARDVLNCVEAMSEVRAEVQFYRPTEESAGSWKVALILPVGKRAGTKSSWWLRVLPNRIYLKDGGNRRQPEELVDEIRSFAGDNCAADVEGLLTSLARVCSEW